MDQNLTPDGIMISGESITRRLTAMLRFGLTLCCFTIVAAPAWAQQVTLSESIRQALVHHPLMKAYYMDTEALYFERRLLTEEFQPQTQLSGRMGGSIGAPELTVISEALLRLRSGTELSVQAEASAFSSPELMAIVRQPLSGHPPADAALEMQELRVHLNVAEKKQLNNLIIQETIERYYAWLSAQSRRQLLTQSAAQAQKLLSDMQQWVQAGRRAPIELEALNIQVMDQQLQFGRAREEEKLAWEALCDVTGERRALPSNHAHSPPRPAIQLAMLGRYQDDTHTYSAQEFSYRHLRNRVLRRSAQAEQKPRVDWRTHLSVRSGDEKEYVPGVWTGVEWSTPRGGVATRRAAEFYAEQDAEKLTQDEILWHQNYVTQIAQLVRQWQNAQESLNVVEARADLSLKKTEHMQALWTAERVSVDEWLNARAQSVADQLAIQDAKNACVLAWVALETYHGTLDEVWENWLFGA
ncbi:MAG: TolC family protein [Pseudomonadota bacterium]